tara:strand:+ start:7290 stop:7667 length:378 start_codon:yes stop_codon:yes gene_type:complete
MRNLFIFFTVINLNLLLAQDNSATIKTINERELKIYKGNSNINIFFEFCDSSNLKDCNTNVIKFDLRGIVKILDDKEKLGKINIQENGTLVYREDGTISIVSMAGIESDLIETNILRDTVREVFF